MFHKEEKKLVREALERVKAAQRKKQVEEYMQAFDAQAAKMSEELGISEEDAKIYLMTQSQKKKRKEKVVKTKDKVAKLMDSFASHVKLPDEADMPNYAAMVQGSPLSPDDAAVGGVGFSPESAPPPRRGKLHGLKNPLRRKKDLDDPLTYLTFR